MKRGRQSPEETQLSGLIDAYTPEMQAAARAARARMRELFPGAIEMAYDNYNAVVIGYSPTEKPSDAVLSLAFMPRWVTLCFLMGAKLDDPAKLLLGEGTTVRHIKLRDGLSLDTPEVLDLMRRAVAKERADFSDPSKWKLVIRSVSPKKKARRPK